MEKESVVSESAVSKSNLEQILDNVNDIVYVHDLEGNFLGMNRAGVELLEYRRSEIKKMNVRDVVNADDLNLAMRNIWDKVSGHASRSSPYQLRCLAKGGREVCLEVSSRIVGGRQIIGIARDVTDLRAHGEALHQLALKDPLTGLSNRRLFDELVRRYIKLAARFCKELSLLFIDIDDFKRVNDQHGHLVGDAVLIRVGRLLRESVRGADCACRFGGEEFAVLIPETSGKRALVLAERIRVRVANESIPAKWGPLSVTVSIGVAEYQTGDSVEGLIDRADRAMYLAKRRGKDRVVLQREDTDDDLRTTR